MKFTLLLSAAALSLTLTACDPTAGSAEKVVIDPDALPEVEVPEISETIMKDVTKQLSADAFQGRAPGTIGEEKTLELLVSKFQEAGLEPGNGESWFQDVPLVEISVKEQSDLDIKTDNGETISLTPGSDFVAVTYQEQDTINITDSEMIFVGYGINAPERDWNDYDGVDVKGKTVVILVNDPDFGTETLDGDFGGRAMTYYGRWTYKFEEAARQGAAAAIIIHDDAPAAYGWGVVESSWTGPQFYAQTSNGGADQTLANGWIQKEKAREILNASNQDMDVLFKAAKEKGFKAVPLTTKATLNFSNEFGKLQSKNVLGILKGAKRPDEYILYTGHWDHLGICKPASDGDNICNGAVDNATGTAALVALADAHAKSGAPDRSIIFLAVTAEESGLLGSKYYAENPIYPLSKTVGGVNMDAFSMAGPAKNLTVIGKGKSQLDIYLEAAAKLENRKPEAEPTPEKGYYYRSDHFSFAKLGVPMVYFEGGEDLIVGGVDAGAAAAKDYTDNRYHGPKDEYDENWDWSGVMADLRLYYRIGRMLSMSEDWPNWNEGDEFKEARDKSRN